LRWLFVRPYRAHIGENSIPLVKDVRAVNVPGGIRISWRPLAVRPYLADIQITRFDSQDRLDSLAVVSPADTVYTDRALVVGQHYRYQVRARLRMWTIRRGPGLFMCMR
jgi:hypothetical protein